MSGIKAFLRRSLPGLYQRLQKMRSEHHRRQWARRRDWINQKYLEYYGLRVLQGPFGGMKYVPQATGSELIPKLLGCYESELRMVVDDAIAKRPQTIIDVGCAEGYYAVGMGLRCPEAHIHAFDVNPKGRSLCHQMATLNGMTDRITIAEFCDTARLNEIPLRNTLLICDCEGYEHELLRPDKVPDLVHCDILVELHDFVNPDITPSTLRRFSKSHDIQLIDSRKPDPNHLTALWFLRDSRDRALAVDEQRVPMQWAYMKTRSRFT
jgi:hypothetical protein